MLASLRLKVSYKVRVCLPGSLIYMFIILSHIYIYNVIPAANTSVLGPNSVRTYNLTSGIAPQYHCIHDLTIGIGA
jgi:hypothetical protein